MSNTENTSIVSEGIDESVPPIRGMSIFSIASGYTPPPIDHSETRFCSGANIASSAGAARHRSNPCATFNGQGSNVKYTPSEKSTQITQRIMRKTDPASAPSDAQHFSIAEAIKTAPLLYLRPIEETPPLSQPEKREVATAAKPKVKTIFNGPLHKTKAPTVVCLPQTYDLAQLCAWHEEREGHQPETSSTTPVWIKKENGRWGHVGNATWPELFAPLLQKLEGLKQELAEIRERQLTGWSHEGARPS